MPGATNNGGKDGPGGVISGETGLTHAGAIVNNKSGNVFVTHFGFWSALEGLEMLLERRLKSV